MKTMAQLEERMRRQAGRGDQRHAVVDKEIGDLAARIVELEAQMALVVAALPKLKVT